MNRREFGIVAAAILLFGSKGCKKPDKQVEKEVLDDFLDPSKGTIVNRKGIENTLFDITRKTESNGRDITVGRATHLGGNYFLTAAHVVDEYFSSMRVTPQWRRGYLMNQSGSFTVVEYDEKNDLALLKSEHDVGDGDAKIHLSPHIPKLGDDISTFLRLVGAPSREDYNQIINGLDFFDKSKSANALGRILLPANSLLLEKRGQVLEYRQDMFAEVDGRKKLIPGSELFTSNMSYDGESGGPVYHRIGTNDYLFAGILTGGLGIKHEIKTPNNPLGYETMQQTGTFFTHRDRVEELVRRYITRSLTN
ncbi:hypothetical protein HN419_00860 [Candidatus Woesearchaeota archaeon]|jgi:hypothetical protein|nr:hypothetical protein [Candidatus Woesearchaeota archaeon]MBT3537452.1 hypothetical protein [Candidatus Woesearchaeota archaeon]MBT4696950.1 hypothetical protein [Candidatus Woesearchaeota archaeon]MBT4717566.1 hypothetical protein [Candidatus Woesearchaeota archaeon]MBT7106238.1 hypothetical protein [Candidatus Woesearchaeota archaeon]